MAVVRPIEILVTTCQGTRYYNYSMNVLKMCKKGMQREVFGLDENKHHGHNGSPRE
jgi:hypothetical protein